MGKNPFYISLLKATLLDFQVSKQKVLQKYKQHFPVVIMEENFLKGKASGAARWL